MKYSNGVLLSLMSPSGFCKLPIQRQREGKDDEQPSDVDELSEDDTDEPRKNREKAGGRACNPVATAGEDALSVLLAAETADSPISILAPWSAAVLSELAMFGIYTCLP